MEKEKNEDKSRSQNLLNIIESLQAQKTFIEERLVLAKKAEIFNDNSRVKEVLKCKKLRNHVGDYIHYKNIGILNVFNFLINFKIMNLLYFFYNIFFFIIIFFFFIIILFDSFNNLFHNFNLLIKFFRFSHIATMKNAS